MIFYEVVQLYFVCQIMLQETVYYVYCTRDI